MTGTTVVLFERARDAIPPSPASMRTLNDPNVIAALAYVAHEITYQLAV